MPNILYQKYKIWEYKHNPWSEGIYFLSSGSHLEKYTIFAYIA